MLLSDTRKISMCRVTKISVHSIPKDKTRKKDQYRSWLENVFILTFISFIDSLSKCEHLKITGNKRPWKNREITALSIKNICLYQQERLYFRKRSTYYSWEKDLIKKSLFVSERCFHKYNNITKIDSQETHFISGWFIRCGVYVFMKPSFLELCCLISHIVLTRVWCFKYESCFHTTCLVQQWLEKASKVFFIIHEPRSERKDNPTLPQFYPWNTDVGRRHRAAPLIRFLSLSEKLGCCCCLLDQSRSDRSGINTITARLPSAWTAPTPPRKSIRRLNKRAETSLTDHYIKQYTAFPIFLWIIMIL